MKIVSLVAAVLLVTVPFLAGCQTGQKPAECPSPVAPVVQPTPTLEEVLNARIQNPFDTTQTVSVFYATDRTVTDPAPQCLDPFFSIVPAAGNRYGICRISVPVNREVGSLDLATAPGSDVHTTFRSLEHLPLDKPSFEQKLREQPEDALVFVHGFNVKFEEAAYRAAQIPFDTKFQGTTYLYSWPAGAQDRFLSSAYIATTYAENQANAKKAQAHFAEFLQSLVAAKKRIFLIVHSMGHQVVLPVVAGLGVPGAIQELILNAPDFPVDELNQIKPALLSVAKRVTLYCSPSDNALLASSRLNKNNRAGSCRAFPGIDVINVSNVDTPALGVGGLGHGYYSGRPVIGDLSQILLGLKAEKRLFLQKSFFPDRETYTLRR